MKRKCQVGGRAVIAYGVEHRQCLCVGYNTDNLSLKCISKALFYISCCHKALIQEPGLDPKEQAEAEAHWPGKTPQKEKT